VNPPRFRAVAWDIDGTLVDSEPLHHEALLAAGRNWDVDLSDLPDQAFRGIHVGDVWKLLTPRLPADIVEADWHEAINDHYVGHYERLVAIPEAIATMRALAGLGVRQVCVSNSARRVVDANIKSLGIEDIIEFSLSFDDVTVGKPDPEPYLAACRKLGLAPAEVVAVEDSRSGVTSARAGGLYVVGYRPSGGDFGEVDLATDRLSAVLELFRAGS
jgi:HAD superfamily hydrolase (TIGR01509 family)